ncbi:MAG: hypothetical protein LBP81_07445 [Treponema sp.]|jgi:hypothetical protein|nr:hypothetical protein [Treponema sp.]
MKSLSAALIIGLFFPLLCFGQTQTGNASYNPSKKGLHISHASMSFNTRVRVTNLKNNRQVIATVDGRIPPSDPRIADISKEAGDAIGMAASGYTEVRLEQLLPEAAVSAAVQPPSEPAVLPEPVVQPAAPPRSPAPVPPPAPEPEVPLPGNIQIVSPPPVQYVLAEQPAQSCAASPVCVAILILAIVAVLLLVAILVLILCSPRVPVWPWSYPVWVRRRLRYMKNRRY